MEDFMQETKKKKAAKPLFRGYRRLFLLVLAVALLGQVVSFLQGQLSQYHAQLKNDFKVILAVTTADTNETLTAWGESLSAKEDILAVKLFSPQDGVLALQQKNPRLAQALVTLGRESMPAYFELKLTERAIHTIEAFAQNIAAEYPNLSVRYSLPQAQLIFYSGVCLQVVNVTALLVLVLFVAFMFLVEAYPVRGRSHIWAGAVSAGVAGVLSLGIMMILVYPTGLLIPALEHFTSWGRQVAFIVFCTLLGWSLGKWQKF